ASIAPRETLAVQPAAMSNPAMPRAGHGVVTVAAEVAVPSPLGPANVKPVTLEYASNRPLPPLPAPSLPGGPPSPTARPVGAPTGIIPTIQIFKAPERPSIMSRLLRRFRVAGQGFFDPDSVSIRGESRNVPEQRDPV